MDVGTETGELASHVIVPTIEGIYFAHAVEQFSLQKNVNPKIHVTDNWPVNKDLFRIIYGVGIILRLGIFHFIQRITNSLQKEHDDFGVACSELSKFIFFEDTGDVATVELELEHGRLGDKAHLNHIKLRQ